MLTAQVGDDVYPATEFREPNQFILKLAKVGAFRATAFESHYKEGLLGVFAEKPTPPALLPRGPRLMTGPQSTGLVTSAPPSVPPARLRPRGSPPRPSCPPRSPRPIPSRARNSSSPPRPTTSSCTDPAPSSKSTRPTRRRSSCSRRISKSGAAQTRTAQTG